MVLPHVGGEGARVRLAAEPLDGVRNHIFSSGLRETTS
jgi:hypothetical protein